MGRPGHQDGLARLSITGWLLEPRPHVLGEMVTVPEQQAVGVMLDLPQHCYQQRYRHIELDLSPEKLVPDGGLLLCPPAEEALAEPVQLQPPGALLPRAWPDVHQQANVGEGAHAALHALRDLDLPAREDHVLGLLPEADQAADGALGARGLQHLDGALVVLPRLHDVMMPRGARWSARAGRNPGPGGVGGERQQVPVLPLARLAPRRLGARTERGLPRAAVRVGVHVQGVHHAGMSSSSACLSAGSAALSFIAAANTHRGALGKPLGNTTGL
mmetsp:Transcript_27792/g.73772  ORF Transcript_27792/g.73772 Transcript_27792/m.73772 type:complete len:273 (+) Transcript_27792:494-1312(+)